MIFAKALILLGGLAVARTVAAEDATDLLRQLQNEVQALRRQLQAADARVNALEQKLAQLAPATPAAAPTPTPPPATSPPLPLPAPVIAGAQPGTFKLPGTDTSIGWGGFILLNAMVSDVNSGASRWGNQELYVPDIPVGDNRHGRHGQFNLHAKESRFWVKSFTPGWGGGLQTLLEIDFDQTPSAYLPRLRHAYGVIGPFLAGQTYTTFTDTAALNEFNAAIPVGNIVVRQPQIRWTQPLLDTKLEASAALEWPSARITPGSDTLMQTPEDDAVPDWIGRLGYHDHWGNLTLAGMARQIRIDLPAKGIDQQRWGGAFNLAGRIYSGELNNWRFMLSHGNVLARYVTHGAYADALLDEHGQLSLLPIISGMLLYQHHWDKAWRANFGASYSRAELPDIVSSDLTEQALSAHFNLLWSPLPQTTFGLEYLHAWRHVADGREGDLHRVHFSTRFHF